MAEKEFLSVFADDFRNLIATRRALGFDYIATENGMLRLDNFFIECGITKREITKDICDKWCTKRSYEAQRNFAARVSNFRVFASYLVDLGVPAYIPPKGMIRKGPKYHPHIYTDDELQMFFSVVDQSQSVPSECPYRAQMLPVFFRILYTSGMRVSELRLVKVKDVDTERGIITVLCGKNHKDRLVPIHPDLNEKCREIRSTIHANSSENEFFFMIRPGVPMTLQCLYRNFRRYLEKAGIPHTGRGPRIHDFRHTFCVNLLRKWILEGKDLLTMLPYMRTMLGHEGFEETAYYLRLTTQMYPYLQQQFSSAFPSLIEELPDEEIEFY